MLAKSRTRRSTVMPLTTRTVIAIPPTRASGAPRNVSRGSSCIARHSAQNTVTRIASHMSRPGMPSSAPIPSSFSCEMMPSPRFQSISCDHVTCS